MMSKGKNILAIDSSTSVLRVGLAADSGQLYEAENHDRYRHAEFIFKLIEDVMNRAQLDKDDIDVIMIATGPGSFTGLRVGMASAKALAVSLEIPIVGLSIYSAISGRLFREYGRTAVLVPSRRNEYYIGLIESPDFNDTLISVITAEELKNRSNLPPLLGIDLDMSRLEISDNRIVDDISFRLNIIDLINTGLARLQKSGGDDIARLEPLYIQDFKPGGTK
ncbi:MAG: tRNA (adenosine(37)-N6)-threonylcarbamoyltransferase complex dimerization subunit type 1 TsaB [candidate division Zixibacteria bacterium HGW-Zixibacteria-1]|nr:MAG: tRNA (adenosine(37)-N6)-threonylcarbamoyltransferase complex dimerization subunit type 1 TsaB [candidate division Zixibacteria bacterium HGW-Zixibacteria-1]